MKPSTVPRYYPQEPCTKTDPANWTCGPVLLGQPQEHGRFTIIAVLAIQPASDIFSRYLAEARRTHDFAGITELPPATTLLVSAKITQIR